MAIQWGSWEYSGGNGMRVGLDVSVGNPSHSDNSVKFTVKVYTQNQYSYSDDQSLNFSGSIGGSKSFYNGAGTAKQLRETKTYTYNYGNNEYGSSPGNRTFTASLSGAYNGVTPSKSVTESIPARPVDNPAPVTGLTSTRLSDTSIRAEWTNHPTSGEPYDDLERRIWDNIGGWDIWRAGGGLQGTSTQFDYNASANRRYKIRMRAINSAGTSSNTDSNYVQTTPAGPSNCTVEKSSVDSVIVRWENGASTTNGYTYDTRIEERVDGGVWTDVGSAAETATSFSRPNRSPGAVYEYRVRARSTVGDTTYSGYAQSGSIQLQSPPAEPTALITTRNTDYSFQLDWTNNPNGSTAPYDSLTVQRYDNVSGAWGTIASLSQGTETTLTDTSTTIDREYQWRIRANNAAGSSAWVYFDTYQTRPAAPSDVTAKAAEGGNIDVSWVNETTLSNYTVNLRYYKDDVLVDDTISLAAGETTYTLQNASLTSTYKFGVRAVSTVGYTSQSVWEDSPEVAAAVPPNAPTGLAPNGIVVDLNSPVTMEWTHNASLDGSDQTAYQIQHRLSGAGTWTVMTEVADGGESQQIDLSASYTNGDIIEWQVRTSGVHADPGPWSATASFSTSTTPVVTINQPDSGVLTTSDLDVVWSYSDVESTPQAHWTVELYDGNGDLLEQKQDDGEATSVTMDTVIVDGNNYTLKVRAQDGDGLRSNWETLSLTADFLPPAAPILNADYSQETGTAILTLTPTADDGGVTTLPTTGVDIQRRLLKPETEDFGPWETLAENVAPDVTLIDTTAPIANDGEYRTIAHSDAPSAEASGPIPLEGSDDRWVYLSAGEDFTLVCRLMGNVALRSTSSRDRALYNFAGRKKPVMFAGESRERVIDVAGLLDGESSSPSEWEHLVREGNVMLFRDPLGHRMFGSVPQVSIDYMGNDMYAISFTVTEVSYP